MDLTNKSTIQQIVNFYDLSPVKGLGQHFILDKDSLNKMTEAANLTESDLVIEIGAGLGSLTRELSQKAGKVIAIEKDPNLIRILPKINSDLMNVEYLEKNILSLDDSFFEEKFSNWTGSVKTNGREVPESYKIVSNLPFYITSAIIRQFLEASPKPEVMVIMIQKEVAERIIAGPPSESVLGISVKFYGEPEIVTKVNSNNFWPEPQVDSSILKITPYQAPKWEVKDTEGFFRLVKAGFRQKRKQLKNSLSHGLELSKDEASKILKSADIDPTRRAQTLSVEDWVSLHNELTAQ